MSAQAQTENPQLARARALVAPSSPREHRTPLSVVPAPLPRSGPGLAVLCAAVLLASLALLLVMNITVSNRQFTLLDLRSEQQELTEVNERLAEQVGGLEAPQNLAARADALGMVTAGGTASLDAATGEFSDAPEGVAAERLSAQYVAPAAQDAAGDAAAPASDEQIDAPRTATGGDAAPSGQDDAGSAER